MLSWRLAVHWYRSCRHGTVPAQRRAGSATVRLAGRRGAGADGHLHEVGGRHLARLLAGRRRHGMHVFRDAGE